MIILSLYQGTRVEGDIVLDLSRLNGSPLTRKLILSGLKQRYREYYMATWRYEISL